MVRFNDRVRQNTFSFEQELAGLMTEFAVQVGRSFSTAMLAACSVDSCGAGRGGLDLRMCGYRTESHWRSNPVRTLDRLDPL
jgi:hypothetical protein